jgi:anti-sigma regulatory factor (Ser/Thr protein kinase)
MSHLPATGRDVLLSVEATRAAPTRVRRALQRAGIGADLEHTVTLLASELVGNSVRHAGMGTEEKIVFFAHLTADHVRCEVADTGPGFDPEVRNDAAGFGLRLVDKLASRWGVSHGDRGTRVWFEIDHRPRRFSRDPR